MCIRDSDARDADARRLDGQYLVDLHVGKAPLELLSDLLKQFNIHPVSYTHLDVYKRQHLRSESPQNGSG